MSNQHNRWIALGTLVAVVASTLMVGAPAAQAKSSTWKKIAIGAGVVTGYGLLKHKKNLAIGGAVVTGLSYLKYRSAKKKETRARQAAIYRQNHYSAVSPYRYNGNGYNGNSYGNGYRQTGYSRYSGNNGNHRGWTQGKHKGWSKSKKHRHHKCHCRR